MTTRRVATIAAAVPPRYKSPRWPSGGGPAWGQQPRRRTEQRAPARGRTTHSSLQPQTRHAGSGNWQKAWQRGNWTRVKNVADRVFVVEYRFVVTPLTDWRPTKNRNRSRKRDVSEEMVPRLQVDRPRRAFYRRAEMPRSTDAFR